MAAPRNTLTTAKETSSLARAAIAVALTLAVPMCRRRCVSNTAMLWRSDCPYKRRHAASATQNACSCNSSAVGIFVFVASGAQECSLIGAHAHIGEEKKKETRMAIPFLLLLLLLLVAPAGGARPGANLVFEAYVSDEDVRVRLVTVGGKAFSPKLTFAGGPSVCPVDTRDMGVVDVFRRVLYPMFDPLAARGVHADAHTFDARFLFGAGYDYVLVTYDRLVLGHGDAWEVASGDDWMPCVEDASDEAAALCVVVENGVGFAFFPRAPYFDESVDGVELRGVKLRPPHDWRTVPSRNVTVPMKQVLRERTVVYSPATHSIAFGTRLPTLGWKIASAVAAFVATPLFFTRLIAADVVEGGDGKHLHVARMVVAYVVVVAVIGIALGARTRALRTVPMIVATAGVVAWNVAVEGVRWWKRWLCAADPAIEMRPLLALAWIALTLSLYALTSHSMVIFPMIMVVSFTAKVVADVVAVAMNAPLEGESKSLMPVPEATKCHPVPIAFFAAHVVANIAYAAVMWHYIVAEFLDTSVEGPWFLQVPFLTFVTAFSAFILAYLRVMPDDDNKRTPPVVVVP